MKAVNKEENGNNAIAILVGIFLIANVIGFFGLKFYKKQMKSFALNEIVKTHDKKQLVKEAVALSDFSEEILLARMIAKLRSDILQVGNPEFEEIKNIEVWNKLIVSKKEKLKAIYQDQNSYIASIFDEFNEDDLIVFISAKKDPEIKKIKQALVESNKSIGEEIGVLLSETQRLILNNLKDTAMKNNLLSN
jgi:hypothetical protein